MRFGKLSYSFNRKEVKDHGEKGSIAGAGLNGKRVLIIDDVITAGTAIREAYEIIAKEGGVLLGMVVSLDRMEKLSAKGDGEVKEGGRSAIEEVRKRYQVPVLSIINLDDLIGALGEKGEKKEMALLEDYRRKWVAGD